MQMADVAQAHTVMDGIRPLISSCTAPQDARPWDSLAGPVASEW